MNRRGLLCGLVVAPVVPLCALSPKIPEPQKNLITWGGIKSKIGDPPNKWIDLPLQKQNLEYYRIRPEWVWVQGEKFA